MARIGIYLPKYYRLGQDTILKEIDSVTLRKEILKITNLLTDEVGGCTSIEVTGYYKFPDGFFSEHPTVEIYCFCDDKKAGDIASKLKPVLTDIKLRLCQNSVGMYVESGTKFIEA
jgi:hypothetical protein